MAKRAFVTGGTGFVGRNLLEELASRGWKVAALHRRGSPTDAISGLASSLVEGDVLDMEPLTRAIPPGVDVVFHVAGDTSLWSGGNREQTRVNVEGTRNVVNAAIRRGAAKLVFTSTWNVYGLWNDVISEEMSKEGLRSSVNYDRSKALAEEEVREGVERGLPGVILNPAHIIGRYDRKNWARMMRMVNDGTLPGVPPGSGEFCHARAVAGAHIAAAERGVSGENYLLPGAPATFMEVFEIIGELLGAEIPSRPVPEWLFKLIAQINGAIARVLGREPDVTPEVAKIVTANPRIASDKAERELGYRPVPLREMLEDCIAWLVEEGMIRQE